MLQSSGRTHPMLQKGRWICGVTGLLHTCKCTFLRYFDSHLIVTLMLFTGVKQGKGCDYSVQSSWADHASESKIPLTGVQNESLGKIMLWLKHKTSRAEFCSQKFCSTLGMWPRASHEFSVPISSLVKMMTMIMSILSRIMSEYAITYISKCFSFFAGNALQISLLEYYSTLLSSLN